jgi:hypothetical protein
VAALPRTAAIPQVARTVIDDRMCWVSHSLGIRY